MVDSRPHQSLRLMLQDLAILAARPLRKKAVLFVILAASIIYCILSLAHIHLIGRRRPRVVSKTALDDYDMDTVLDAADHIPPPPNIFTGSSSTRTSSSHHADSQMPLFLKRQHQLKETLEESAAAKSIDGHPAAGPHLDVQAPGDHAAGTASSTPSDTFGGLSSGGGVKCRNSIQGKYLIADDRGYVCPRKAVGINGCCSTTSANSLYSCTSCTAATGCCAVYEHCISCCMAPGNRDLLQRLVAEKKSAVFQIFIASITDYFELCLTKCRTSSASVKHENTYLNPDAKHCYGDSSVVKIKSES